MDLFDAVRRNYLLGQLQSLRSAHAAALSEARDLMANALSSQSKHAGRPTKQIDVDVHTASWVLLNDEQSAVATARLDEFKAHIDRRDDSSNECWLVLRGLRLVNNLRTDVYAQALEPQDPSSEEAVRMYFKRCADVGGVPIYEHLELTTSPYFVRLTADFYAALQSFLLPPQAGTEDAGAAAAGAGAGSGELVLNMSTDGDSGSGSAQGRGPLTDSYFDDMGGPTTFHLSLAEVLRSATVQGSGGDTVGPVVRKGSVASERELLATRPSRQSKADYRPLAAVLLLRRGDAHAAAMAAAAAESVRRAFSCC